MVVREDPAKLWALMDDDFAVKVVKHNHVPKEKTKYLGNVQTKYKRKNWSSVILWNCAHPDNKILTPDYVNSAEGLELHQFSFLKYKDIGEIPSSWNHLVGYDKMDGNAKLIHYTEGGPYFSEYKNCDYHQDWWKEKALMENIVQRKK